MKIIIVGDGKVGFALAEHLSQEEHDVTVIDTNDDALRRAAESLDVLCIKGNGASLAALREAGIAPNPELLVDEELPPERLSALFRDCSIDGAAVRFNQADRIREFAVSHGIRIPQDLQLITGCTSYDWNPTMTEKPFAAIVSRLLNQLWNEMRHTDSSLQDSSLQWNIRVGNSTR